MTSFYSRLKATLCAVAVSLAAAGAAQAAGTAAGTSVSNTFSLDYKVGTVDQPTIDNTGSPTLFTVDRNVDLTVTSSGNTTVVPNQQDAQLVFSLLNSGNDTQGYVLSVVDETEAGAADDHFAVTGEDITYYFDTGAGGTPDGVFNATDTAGTAHAYTPGSGVATEDVAPDALIWIVVDADIPSLAADPSLSTNDTADISLVADTVVAGSAGGAGVPVTADTGGNTLTGAAENVLADGESLSDGTYDNEDANNGDHAATAAYVISTADIVASKSVGVLSEDGTGCVAVTFPLSAPPTTELAIPGACVEYRVTVQNTGGAAATDITLSDVLPNNLTFKFANHNGFTGGTLTDPAEDTDCDGTGATCTVTLGGTAGLAASSTGTLVIRALIQ